MNLVVSAITMVDLTNKEAKRVYFSPGKNLITSAHNHLGKSVIMKSIYYTLGAEVYYPNPIKKLNLLTYIDFSLNTHQHRVARLKSTFILYCDGSFSDFPFFHTLYSTDHLCQQQHFLQRKKKAGGDNIKAITSCISSIMPQSPHNARNPEHPS